MSKRSPAKPQSRHRETVFVDHCTIDPAADTFCSDQTLMVTVGDGGICLAADSEEETYTLRTVVNASDNP